MLYSEYSTEPKKKTLTYIKKVRCFTPHEEVILRK